MTAPVIVHSPPSPDALFLLFHGVGATPQDLQPLGALIAARFPQAAVISVPGPDRSDLGAGLQWFSVRGVTEEDRPQRVAATLQRFADTVRHWQAHTGVAPAATTLVGFSQGAIMALASTRLAPPPAARVVSLSGRFDALPEAVPAGVRWHFLHGGSDPVIPSSHASAAARRLQALGADVTLDLFAGAGHGIDRQMADRLLALLEAR